MKSDTKTASDASTDAAHAICHLRRRPVRSLSTREFSTRVLPVSVWEGLLILSLTSCHNDKQGADTSTTSSGKVSSPSTDGCITTGATSANGNPTTTVSPTSTGVDSGVCSNSAPIADGPCAPFGPISAGPIHTCTLVFGGKLRCWGANLFGELGQGHVDFIGDDETPGTSPPVDLGEAAIQVAAGLYHTCAVTEGGGVYCWGSGSDGRLGYGNTISLGDDEPAGSAGPVPLTGSAIQVTAGSDHTCALMSDGSVYCWGRGELGQLGTGNTANIGDDEVPGTQTPVDLGGPAVQLSSYANHTCAVLEGGGVICWGNGEAGQLGRGNTENVGDDETPGAAGPIDVGAPVARVATGSFYTCALTIEGEVRCWGSAGAGALGYGNNEYIGDDEHPSEAGAVSLGRPAVGIAAGSATTCAILDDGTIRCWGSGYEGQLGNGTTSETGSVKVPSDYGTVAVGGTVVQVTAGVSHVCALLADDSIRCWGQAGMIGYGNTGSWGDENSLCYGLMPDSFCDLGPLCCIGDMPGEMPPPPVQYQ